MDGALTYSLTSVSTAAKLYYARAQQTLPIYVSMMLYYTTDSFEYESYQEIGVLNCL